MQSTDHTTEPDPITLPCEGCGAEPGEPCDSREICRNLAIPPLRPRDDCKGCQHGLRDVIGYVVAYSRLDGDTVTFEDIEYVEGAHRAAVALQLANDARRKVMAGEVDASYAVIHWVYVGGHRTS